MESRYGLDLVLGAEDVEVVGVEFADRVFLFDIEDRVEGCPFPLFGFFDEQVTFRRIRSGAAPERKGDPDQGGEGEQRDDDGTDHRFGPQRWSRICPSSDSMRR